MTLDLLENPETPAEATPEADPAGAARLIECLLFVAGEPLSARSLARSLELDEAAIEPAVRHLRARYVTADSALQVLEIAGGYQLSTRPELGPLVGRYLAPHANRLSRPALETVTIVAYRQPLTQAEVEAIRGVSSDGVLKTLAERELIAEVGRKATPGRPILYGTTDGFLHYFGLTSLTDLPPLDEDEPEAAAETEEAVHSALAAAGAAE